MALPTAARATDVVGGLALVVAWSSGFIGAELGTRDASASTLLAWRYAVAAAVLVLLVAWTRRGWRVRRPLRHAAIGLLCQATYLGGVVGGVGLGVPPGTAALIAAGQPLMVSVLERVLLGSTPSLRQRVGLALGVVGVALVVSSDLGRGSAPAWAYLLPLAGTLGLSVGTVLDRRWRLDDDVLTGLTAQTAVVAVVMLGGAQVGGDLAPPTSSTFWLAVAWVVVLSTFGGYGLYFWVLRRSGASAVSTWLYLTPPCTMLWAAVAFGDRPGPAAYVGTAVCALAVVVWTGVTRHITLVPYISPRGSAISSRRAPLGSRK
jgi:drug/metabolite transporter (DMT)-like permease